MMRFFQTREEIYYPISRIEELEVDQIKNRRAVREYLFKEEPEDNWIIVFTLAEESYLTFSYLSFETKQLCKDYIERELNA